MARRNSYEAQVLISVKARSRVKQVAIFWPYVCKSFYRAKFGKTTLVKYNHIEKSLSGARARGEKCVFETKKKTLFLHALQS